MSFESETTGQNLGAPKSNVELSAERWLRESSLQAWLYELWGEGESGSCAMQVN